MILPVSNLICCFNIPFFFCLWVLGDMHLHSVSCSSAQSCISCLLNVTPNQCLISEGIHMWYSASLIPQWWQAWFARRQEKAWVRPTEVPTCQGLFGTLTQRERASIIDLLPQQLPQWEGPQTQWTPVIATTWNDKLKGKPDTGQTSVPSVLLGKATWEQDLGQRRIPHGE